MDWCVESKQYGAGAELIRQLGLFFYTAGLRSEFGGRCEQLLTGKIEFSSRANLLFWAAHYKFYTDPSTSLRLGSELVTMGRSTGDKSVMSHGLHVIALVQMVTQPEEAVRTIEEAIPLAQEAGPPFLLVDLLDFKSFSYLELGRPGEAFDCAEKAVRAGEEADFLWGTALARARLAAAALWTGRLARALEEAESVLALGTELSDPLLVLAAEGVRGEVALLRDVPGAFEAFDHARAVAETCGDRVNLAGAEASLGHLQASLGELESGYRMLESATAKLEALGFSSVSNRAEMAEVALRRGDLDSARRHLAASPSDRAKERSARSAITFRAAARLARAEGRTQRALSLACDGLQAALSSGAMLLLVDLLEIVVKLSADIGQCEKAARFFGAADQQRELTGYPRSAVASQEFVPVLAVIEATLGQDGFEQARAEGRVSAPKTQCPSPPRTSKSSSGHFRVGQSHAG